jgi:putative membrane protein
MSLIISLLLNALSLYIASYVLDGVKIDNIQAALIAGVLLGVANFVVKPVLKLLAMPITLLTLGLFLLVINALVLLLVDYFVPGFEIQGFLTAVLLGIVIWALNLIYGMFGLKVRVKRLMLKLCSHFWIIFIKRDNVPILRNIQENIFAW